MNDAQKIRDKVKAERRSAEAQAAGKREARAEQTNGGGERSAPNKLPYDWRKGLTDMEEVHTMTFDPSSFSCRV